MIDASRLLLTESGRMPRKVRAAKLLILIGPNHRHTQWVMRVVKALVRSEAVHP